MTRRARAERKKKIKTAQRKLQPGWKPGRSKRRKQKAAAMIQRAYRSHLLRQAFQRSRQNVRFTFTSLRAFGHARSRHHWRNVDLRRLSREELRLLALTLSLPSTGKKVLLICRIQRWVDQHVLANDMAAQAAARALELRRKAQGSVYFCEAHPGADLVDIHPLRGHHITSIAAVRRVQLVFLEFRSLTCEVLVGLRIGRCVCARWSPRGSVVVPDGRFSISSGAMQPYSST